MSLLITIVYWDDKIGSTRQPMLNHFRKIAREPTALIDAVPKALPRLTPAGRAEISALIPDCDIQVVGSDCLADDGAVDLGNHAHAEGFLMDAQCEGRYVGQEFIERMFWERHARGLGPCAAAFVSNFWQYLPLLALDLSLPDPAFRDSRAPYTIARHRVDSLSDSSIAIMMVETIILKHWAHVWIDKPDLWRPGWDAPST
ncbi:MAG: hypothetical protein FJ276_16680 [Planctomycetes bacterium]|nr:hypothetical protein [Planctomycetota bacterium]